jgi:hypothetical protein
MGGSGCDSDVLLINEFDFDPAAADLFRTNFLEVSQNGAANAFRVAPIITDNLAGQSAESPSVPLHIERSKTAPARHPN